MSRSLLYISDSPTISYESPIPYTINQNPELYISRSIQILNSSTSISSGNSVDSSEKLSDIGDYNTNINDKLSDLDNIVNENSSNESLLFYGKNHSNLNSKYADDKKSGSNNSVSKINSTLPNNQNNTSNKINDKFTNSNTTENIIFDKSHYVQVSNYPSMI